MKIDYTKVYAVHIFGDYYAKVRVEMKWLNNKVLVKSIKTNKAFKVDFNDLFDPEICETGLFKAMREYDT